MGGKYLSGGALTHYKWLEGKDYNIVIPTQWRGHRRCQYYNLEDSPMGYTKYVEIFSICSLGHCCSSCRSLISFQLPYGTFIF